MPGHYLKAMQKDFIQSVAIGKRVQHKPASSSICTEVSRHFKGKVWKGWEWVLEQRQGSGNLQEEGGGLVGVIRSPVLVTDAYPSKAPALPQRLENKRVPTSGIDWNKQ